MDKQLETELKDAVEAIKTAKTENDKKTAQKVAIEILSRAFEPEAKETVKEIEAKFETTQNHYGDYMRVLTGMNGLYRYGFALALQKAGAGQGLDDALMVIRGE